MLGSLRRWLRSRSDGEGCGFRDLGDVRSLLLGWIVKKHVLDDFV